MPYYRKNANVSLDGLIDRLAQELKGEPSLLTEDGPMVSQNAPTIIEEDGLLKRLNVTVVWDAWQELSGEQRGHVIMQAYEKAKGPLIKSRIGLAMGLTRAQSQRILNAA